MKAVTVYEIGQTQRVLEVDSINKIPAQEWVRDGGRSWGNPGGGDRFIRYDLPVVEVVTREDRDGFVHEERAYVAIAPSLLRKLGPAVNKGLSDLVHERTREVEDLLRGQRANLAALQRARDEAATYKDAMSRHLKGLEAAEERLRNFEQAHVLQRIWRAITRAI